MNSICIISISIVFHSALFAQVAGSALVFDGSDYVDVPDFSFSASAITVEAWVNHASIASTIQRYVTLVNEVAEIRFDRGSGHNDFKFRIKVDGTIYEKRWNAGLSSTGRWYHIAGTWDGTNQRLYRNGIYVGRETEGNLSTATSAVFSSSTEPMDGIIDEIRIWNVGIPRGTIRTYMNRKITSNHPYWNNLVGYWKFDEGSGSTAGDSSTNSNHGTIYGATWTTSTAPIGDASIFSEGNYDITEISGCMVDVDLSSEHRIHTYGLIQINSKPNTTTGLLNNYANKFWEIWATHPEFDGNFTATVKFHYDEIVGIGDESELKLYRRDDAASSSWSALSGITIYNEGSETDGTGYIEYTITQDTTGDFSGQYIITSSSGDNPLPVEITSFIAKQEKSNVVLQWVTESEIENLGFIIERREEGTEEWSEIASYLTHPELQGQGSVTHRTEYSFVDSTVVSGNTYDYRLADVSYDGMVEYHELTSLTVEQYIEIPVEFSLYQNYPNPFNPITHIRYDLPEQVYVVLVIYDLLGREVITLINKVEEPGYKSVIWDGKDTFGRTVGAGMYLYKISALQKDGGQAGDPSTNSGHSFVQTMKMLLLK